MSLRDALVNVHAFCGRSSRDAGCSAANPCHVDIIVWFVKRWARIMVYQVQAVWYEVAWHFEI